MEMTLSSGFRNGCGILFSIMLLTPLLTAQNVQNKPESLSYLIIVTDTSHVPIYIDGVLMGYSPLKEPVPVPAGFHTISFLPGSVQNIYQDQLGGVVKQVYIAPADTQTVFLETVTYRQELLKWRTDRQRSTVVGLTMGLLALVLIWIAAL